MAIHEITAQLKQGFEAQIEKVEVAKTELVAKVEMVDQLVVEVEAEKKASFDAGYEEGLAQAGQAGGADKIYSDAELNADLAPLKEQIAQLEIQVADLSAQLEQAKTELIEAPAQAVAAFKAELAAKYAEQQAAETAGETELMDLLK